MKEVLRLDLRQAILSKKFPDFCPKYIPIQRGNYCKDFDVIEEEMPPGWKGRYVMHWKRLGLWNNKRMVFPVGFNVEELPSGARIVSI